MLRICDPIRNVDSADLLFLEMFNLSRNKNAFIEVLGTADSLVNYNESITNIVLEEASGYFDGQKSAEAVAKVIQSKVQIYVNENR